MPRPSTGAVDRMLQNLVPILYPIQSPQVPNNMIVQLWNRHQLDWYMLSSLQAPFTKKINEKMHWCTTMRLMRVL